MMKKWLIQSWRNGWFRQQQWREARSKNYTKLYCNSTAKSTACSWKLNCQDLWIILNIIHIMDIAYIFCSTTASWVSAYCRMQPRNKICGGILLQCLWIFLQSVSSCFQCVTKTRISVVAAAGLQIDLETAVPMHHSSILHIAMLNNYADL